MQKFLSIFLATLILFSPLAFSASSIQVEAFQSPAWVVNESGKIALRPGIKLDSSDQITTGQNGKVVLRLSEGSQVKLGENALFEVNDLSSKKDSSSESIFQSAMQVLRGAFRFTTSQLGKQNRREIDIQLTTATIGIRGTDLWGRASSDQDFVCLLEGKIAINRGSEPEVTMSEALSLYTADKNQLANPLTKADKNVVARLALETELDQGQGVINENGRYAVNLSSSKNKAYAENEQARLNQLGYATDIEQVTIDNAIWYRVVALHFASLNDAMSFSEKAKQNLNISSPWIQTI